MADEFELTANQASDATAFILAQQDWSKQDPDRFADLHRSLSLLVLAGGGRFRADDVVERVRRTCGEELATADVADALKRAADTPL